MRFSYTPVSRKEEWKTKTEWSLAAEIMRMLYRRAGYDYHLRLIHFVEKDGAVKPEEEVFIYPKDEKDDETLLYVLRERLIQV
jgi:hypothetical protein